MLTPQVDDFKAFMEAINRCVMDSLTVRLEQGGLFDSADEFVAVFVELLD